MKLVSFKESQTKDSWEDASASMVSDRPQDLLAICHLRTENLKALRRPTGRAPVLEAFLIFPKAGAILLQMFLLGKDL
jgi:hypothetical protein